jgi:hypothetical protein
MKQHIHSFVDTSSSSAAPEQTKSHAPLHNQCSSQEEPIHVALSSDNNYFEGLLVTAWTIVTNCSSNNLIIHILDGGISKENWNFLKTTLPESRCILDRIEIDQDAVLKNFPDYHGASKMTFARLLLQRKKGPLGKNQRKCHENQIQRISLVQKRQKSTVQGHLCVYYWNFLRMVV